jgi:hypothetical protein
MTRIRKSNLRVAYETSDVDLKREVIAAKKGRHEQQAVVMGRNLSLAMV